MPSITSHFAKIFALSLQKLYIRSSSSEQLTASEQVSCLQSKTSRERLVPGPTLSAFASLNGRPVVKFRMLMKSLSEIQPKLSFVKVKTCVNGTNDAKDKIINGPSKGF